MRDTMNDLYPGAEVTVPDAAAKEDAKLRVEFLKAPVMDQIPTEGGFIDKDEFPEERMKELQAYGCKFRPSAKEPSLIEVRKSGRLHMKEVVFIRIQRPGERDFIERPVEDFDKVRFAKQWERFENGMTGEVEGTPLTALPFVDSAQRAELAFFGVVTAEQFAGMAFANAQKFSWYHGLKAKVDRYLAAQEASAPFVAQDAKMAALHAELESLREQVKAQHPVVVEPSPTPEAERPQPQPQGQRTNRR